MFDSFNHTWGCFPFACSAYQNNAHLGLCIMALVPIGKTNAFAQIVSL